MADSTEDKIVKLREELKPTLENAERIEKAQEAIAARVNQSQVIEERSFGVGDAEREDFLRLYEDEIRVLGECPLKDIGKSGKGAALCRRKFSGFKQFLTHLSVHLMMDANGIVQSKASSDARELVYPSSEKTKRVALSAEERMRMLRDPEHRKRIDERREQRRRMLDS